MRERAILLTHCSQLLTLRGNLAPRRGGAMRELGIIEDGAVLIDNGKIAAVGSTDEPWVRGKDVDEIDCRDKVALPGFVVGFFWSTRRPQRVGRKLMTP